MSVASTTTSEFPTSREQYERNEWPYDDVEPRDPTVDTDAAEFNDDGHEVLFRSKDGGVYAGTYLRWMIHNSAHAGEDQPLVFGLDEYGEVSGMLHHERFRHMFIGGQTGTGKTTCAIASTLQDAYAGNGFCVVLPSEEDSLELVRRLPRSRIANGDFVYLSPGDTLHDYSVGLNFLDTLLEPGEEGFQAEVESLVRMLLPMVNADEYARMKGAAENLLRFLIKGDYEDSEYDYTVIDLYYLVGTKEARERYAEMVEQSKLHFLKPYAQKFHETLGDSELEPLIRRLKSWVENPVIREFIATRDSDISLPKAMADQKMIVVNADLGKNERQLVNTAITAKMWATATARPTPQKQRMMDEQGIDPPSYMDGEYTFETPEYFLTVDEFHAVVTEEMDVDEILAMARKKKLGLTILTQQLNQLEDNQQKAILNNCSTFISFDPGRDPDEKRVLAQGFDGVSPDELNVGRFSFWTTVIKNDEGEPSEPYRTEPIPPYPPRRNMSEANDLIREMKEIWGSERLTDEEILEQVPSEFSPAETGVEPPGGGVPTADNPAELVTKAVFDEWIATLRDDDCDTDPDGWVTAQSREMADRVDKLLPGRNITSSTQLSGLMQKAIHSGYLEYDSENETVRVTKEGLGEILPTEEGNIDHGLLLADGYVVLSYAGLEFEVGTGSGEPDGRVYFREAAGVDTDEMDLLELLDHAPDIRKRIEEKFALARRLTGGADATVEAECTTSDSKQGQAAVKNLQKAVNNGKKCIYVVRPHVADSTLAALTDPPFVSEVRPTGNQRLYNTGVMPGENDPNEACPVLTNARECRWMHNPESGRYWLEDADGNRKATFDSAEEISTDPEDYPASTDDFAESEYKGNDADHVRVYHPVVPELRFEGGLPDTDDWEIIQIPEDTRSSTTPLEDAQLVTEYGDRVPLSALDSDADDSDEGQEDDQTTEPTEDDGGSQDHQESNESPRGDSPGDTFDAFEV